MMEPTFYGEHPYALMHLPSPQRQRLTRDQLHSWTMQRQAVSNTLAASFLNLPPTVYEEEDTDAPISTASNTHSHSSNGASTSPLIMARDHPDRARPPPGPAHVKYGFPLLHFPHLEASHTRYLPPHVLDHHTPADRFRSLNRPKLGVNAVSSAFNQAGFLPRKFSKSDWDLRAEIPHAHVVRPGPQHQFQPHQVNTGYQTQSSGTSVAESADNHTDPGSERSVEQGVMRRHHGHYFSNVDLFSQPNDGFNYLKYAKANDFNLLSSFCPHVRILDFSFELDSRSQFDRLMLQSNASLEVLSHISLDLVGGDTVALMYTSEPELRCLLALLTNHNCPRGKVTGLLEVNGHHLKASQFADRTAHVSLLDPPKWLTVTQYLDYYTRLTNPATNAVPRTRLIDQLIHGLALGPLRKRLCKELSWTEKQRVKLAAQMVLDTDVLLIDNIIQHMDLYDAAFVIDFIRDWAQRFNRIVLVATTPSTMELLTMFKKTAILSSGKLIYCGNSVEMCDYFESVGFPCPQFKNPCDYYVDLVTHDLLSPDSSLESSARIRTLAEMWQHKQPPPSAPQANIVSPKTTQPSGAVKAYILYLRFWSVFFNRPWPRLSEFFFAAVFSLLLGWLYLDLPRDRRAGIDDRGSFLMAASLVVPYLLSVMSMVRVFEDRKMLHLDYTYNLYSTAPYLASKLAFDLPFALFTAMTAATPAYFLSNLNPQVMTSTSALLTFLTPIVLNSLILRYSAWILGYCIRSKILSMTLTGFLFLSNTLFSGFVVPSEDQWRPFGVDLQYLNPTFWFRKELLDLTFLSGKQSTFYRFFESLIAENVTSSELIIDCLKKPVIATKLTVPVVTVKKCLKTTGSQIINFEGYGSSLSSDHVVFGWLVVACWTLVILFLLVVVISCCNRKSSRQIKK